LDYEVTQDLVKMHTDIRFRLLAILPPIAAAGVALVSAPAVGLSPFSLFAIGSMGFLLTLGCVLYDLRNSDLYNACVHRAKILEGVMGFVRSGDETIPISPSTETALPEGAAPPAKEPNKRWAGGAHRQRAVRYLNFLGLPVSHGSALALVYGVLLGAWVFPIAKGLLIGIAYLVIAWKLGSPMSSGSGFTTSLLAFALAFSGAYAFWRALNATDAPNAVHGLYPEAEPHGADEERENYWRSNAKGRAAREVAAKAAKSWVTTTVVATDPGEGLFTRLKGWWRR
jgi:hypothetical protein